jgi:hypothetical protein
MRTLRAATWGTSAFDPQESFIHRLLNPQHLKLLSD